MRRGVFSTILLLSFALVAGAATTQVLAKGGSQLLPKESLYNKVFDASKDEIKAICAEIIARQDASAVGRMDAAQLYMHGMIMGVTCIKVDYYKALVLAHDSGDAFSLKASLTYVRERAAAGIDKAIKALAKYEKQYK